MVPPIVIVYLRQPKNDPKEMRSDPFWEYGSFGLTGCHKKNLLHPKTAPALCGTRLAFAQGGDLGVKLVFLSPPVTVVEHMRYCESVWENPTMPFCYPDAPLLIDGKGDTDFPKIIPLIKDIRRASWEACFASKFRSRKMPLNDGIASQMEQVYASAVLSSCHTSFAETYVDAMPFPPPTIDGQRRSTYSSLLLNASGLQSANKLIQVNNVKNFDG